MGEARRKALAARRGAGDEPAEPQVVDTLGGRMHVRWDEGAAAMPHGQLVFFAEFLAATGVFERWVSECPLSYRSGNAPDKRDVLGTLLLGLLAGHRRYAHITALRGDAVAAQALGMNKVVSEDALRRALERIDEVQTASHANQTTLYLTPLHGRADLLKRLIANIGAALQHVKAAAEQFKELDRWGCLVRYISDRIAPVIGPPRPPPRLPATG